MKRVMATLTCLTWVVTGCQEAATPAMFEMPQKPTPSPELRKLDRLVGSWTGEGEFLEPKMPADAAKPKSQGKAEWVMGGMYLKQEGWYEMGEGQRANFVEYVTWDPKSGKHKSWWFDDWGNRGAGTMTFTDANTMRAEMCGTDGKGEATRGEGTMAFVGNDAMTWTWTEHGAMGTMKMKGTSKRTAP